MPPRAAPAPMPPRPPMAPPGPRMAGPPPVAGMGGMAGMGNIARPPMGPPIAAGLRRHGGRAYAKGGKVKMEEGAGGGEGRLAKIKEYGGNSKVKEPGIRGSGSSED
jgi:hypothetical protein